MKDTLIYGFCVIIMFLLVVGGWYIEYRIKVSAYKQALIEYNQENPK